jgi:osmotically-inducible protein OsmY
MNQLKRIATFLAVALLATVIGCSSSPSQESAGEYVSDSWITTKVKAVLAEDSQVKATEVNVETFKGMVQLTGFVSSHAAMTQAVTLTRGIKGVTGVRNDMRLK